MRGRSRGGQNYRDKPKRQSEEMSKGRGGKSPLSPLRSTWENRAVMDRRRGVMKNVGRPLAASLRKTSFRVRKTRAFQEPDPKRRGEGYAPELDTHPKREHEEGIVGPIDRGGLRPLIWHCGVNTPRGITTKMIRKEPPRERAPL